MSCCFKLTKSKRNLLILLIILAATPFFFIHSTTKFYGISLFAWLLVGVMILTPLITISELLITNQNQ